MLDVGGGRGKGTRARALSIRVDISCAGYIAMLTSPLAIPINVRINPPFPCLNPRFYLLLERTLQRGTIVCYRKIVIFLLLLKG